MIKGFPRILFFIAGPTPTPEEYDEASRYQPNVVFRNASLVSSESSVGSLELCDGVAGAVPEIYAKNRPSAQEAGEKFMREGEDRNWKKRDELAKIAEEVAKKEERKREKETADKIAKQLKAQSSQQSAPGGITGAATWTPNQ